MIAAINTSANVVLITGASRGLGKYLAFEYASRGFKVMLCARNETELEANCTTIKKNGGTASYIKCNVMNAEEMDKAAQHTLQIFGRIDIAILNAGIGISNRFSNFNRKDFDLTFATNLSAVINGFDSIIPIMKHQGKGTIVGIGSLADTRAIPGSAPYIASKAALKILLEAAAIDLKPLGINVITVRPGFLSTDMTSGNKRKMPMLMPPAKAAKIIVNGILKKSTSISFPRAMSFLSFVSGIIPSFIWRHKFRIRAEKKKEFE